MTADHDEIGLMTTVDLAGKLNISVETVRRMCRSKQWQAVKIGRIYRFTEAQYQAIVTPPPTIQRPRTQRKNIDRLLRSTP
ncbi:helix-turn-helix domain-containing protein [Arthrobacter sp. FW306-2-2C-D06B]|uniref:helix-turn-helix domain-containing protein n=1 Tax=Arthrobacter sp. FW306-2-2C-D06B TaxID=2879618 RepID=UPI003FA41768|nr:helix-turn-helix domain-containing protein [Arthrobacter sp. FW306-2-2C-D06B]